VVSEELGVFVAPTGSDAGRGTRTSPYATLTHAVLVARALGKRVYACAGTFDERLTIGPNEDGIAIFGGLACPVKGEADAWAYTGSPAVLSPSDPGEPALTVVSLSEGLVIQDLDIVAPSTRFTRHDGASSIAALVTESQGVLFDYVSFEGGDAADGANGTAGMNATSVPNSTIGAGAGNNAYLGVATDAIKCTCNTGDISYGGFGTAGHAAMDGLPFPGGKGGKLTTVLGPCDAARTGGRGHDGVQGFDGWGATALGQLSRDGWQPASGADGGDGEMGTGGGGGTTAAVDSEGGGGGCGGCPGTAGTGGQGGGASVGLIVYSSAVELRHSTASGGWAGRGGSGAYGGLAQLGGPAGQGFGEGCDGGDGGNGGMGGRGGGGAGGISVGILWHGIAPTLNASVASGFMAGTGGFGAGAQGVKGVATDLLEQ